MADEKDRFGQQLRDKEKGDEERFFAERDKAVLDKLRQRMTTGELEQIREAALGRCPKDGTRLVKIQHQHVIVDGCPSCHGVWLEQRDLEAIAGRERDSWLGRLFLRPKR
jgi:hypothetical protein